MPEILAFGALCFIVGYMTRPKLYPWLYLHRPVRCPECGRWQQYGKMFFVNHRLAGRVAICGDCYRTLYKPFEGK